MAEEKMLSEHSVLINLLSAGIRDEELFLELACDLSWDIILKEATLHEIHTLLFPTIKRLSAAAVIPHYIRSTWEKMTFMHIYNEAIYRDEIETILANLNSIGIKFLVLKGLFFRQLYKYPELRTMGDYDLFVDKNSVEEVKKVFLQAGYLIKHLGETVTTFIKVDTKKAEVHTSLFDRAIIDDKTSFDKMVWNNPVKILIGSSEAYTLSVDNTLIYTILHLAKHMKNSSSGLRQLSDLTLFLEKYHNEIDWEYFWMSVRGFGLEVFSLTAIKVCINYLKLKGVLQYLHNETSIGSNEIGIFINKTLSGGVFGNKVETYSIGSSIGKSVHKEKYNKSIKIDIIIRIILFAFPNLKVMSVKAPYLTKQPYLLPVAWLERILHAVRTKYSFKDLGKVISCAVEEEKFLKKTGL